MHTLKLGSVESANGFGKLLPVDGNSNSCDGNVNDEVEGAGDEAVNGTVVVILPVNFDQSDVNEFPSEVASFKNCKSIRSVVHRLAANDYNFIIQIHQWFLNKWYQISILSFWTDF